ncbi:Transcriptional regulatory protein WalR [bacterium HR27]|nr:Transcriptional regulatory protein WalR [bacterium HR27]
MYRTVEPDTKSPHEPTAQRRILVVEDDPTLVQILAYSLQQRGYSVWAAQEGRQAIMLARTVRPDLIVLDLMLPGIDGRDVCRLIRKWSNAPILVLTARDSEDDIVALFQAGADDYVTKPFRTRELFARIEALLRRSGEQATGSVLTAGTLVIFRDEHRVVFRGREIHLAPREFALLAALVERAGRVCTRQELLDLVWGQDIVDLRNVDVHIHRIREALGGEENGARLIRTVHGIGYRFVPELTIEETRNEEGSTDDTVIQ